MADAVVHFALFVVACFEANDLRGRQVVVRVLGLGHETHRACSAHGDACRVGICSTV
ncbi:MAG: hypothetical protein ACRDVG_13200 [Jatrophihabitantaceae bacterium]